MQHSQLFDEMLFTFIRCTEGHKRFLEYTRGHRLPTNTSKQIFRSGLLSGLSYLDSPIWILSYLVMPTVHVPVHVERFGGISRHRIEYGSQPLRDVLREAAGVLELLE